MDDIDVIMELEELNKQIEDDERLFGGERELGFEIKEVLRIDEDTFRLHIDDGERVAIVDVTPFAFLWFAEFYRVMKKHDFEPNAVTRGTWLDVSRYMMTNIADVIPPENPARMLN